MENALLPALFAAGRRRNIPVFGKKLPVWLVVKSKEFSWCRPVQKRTWLYKILTPVLPRK
jgi:hypothetical protein